MNKKQIIITFSAILVASYAGFFLYQRYQRRKADKAIDSYEEAMRKLKEAKEGFNPLYSEPTEEDFEEGEFDDIKNSQPDTSSIDINAYSVPINDSSEYDPNCPAWMGKNFCP